MKETKKKRQTSTKKKLPFNDTSKRGECKFIRGESNFIIFSYRHS